MLDPAPPLDDRDALARWFGDICVLAGAAIMEVRARADLGARRKDDGSPVCEADERAEALIVAALRRFMPRTPVIAEEQSARGETPVQSGAFLLVDPLDGTKNFIAGGDEFTVNVALILAGAPSAGAVYAPALGRLWIGGASAYVADVAPGQKPLRQAFAPIAARRPAQKPLRAVVSQSHLDPETIGFLDQRRIGERVLAASSLKFCVIAQGDADLYPRFSPTMEWDVAAGDAVLRAAGGAVLTPGGGPFLYGKAAERYRNGAFIAWGDPDAATIS